MKWGFAATEPDVGKSIAPSRDGCADEGAVQADAANNIAASPVTVSRVIEEMGVMASEFCRIP